MAKDKYQNRVPSHYYKADMPKGVLEGVLKGDYDRTLDEPEKAVIAAVPPELRPWFEKVVVEGFYLEMRHVVRKSLAAPDVADCSLLETLADELLPPNPNGAIDEGRERSRRNIWEAYKARQEGKASRGTRHRTISVPFQDAANNALQSYAQGVKGVLHWYYDNDSPVNYRSVSEVIQSVREKI